MAIMIPSEMRKEDFNESPAEYQIYQQLKNLPDEFVVFHSVRWKAVNYSGYIKNGEADFTVFHPKRGLLVIEAKSGAIELKNGIWYQTNRRTLETKRMDPMKQAERSSYQFADIIESAMEKTSSFSAFERKYWVQPVTWFTSASKEDFKKVTLPPNYMLDIMLFEEDLHNIKGAILRVFDFYKMYEKHNLPESDKDMIVHALSPEFSVIPSVKSIYHEQEYFFNRMTREQSYLLDYLEEQRVAAIQGGAGTGKTMIAIEKARRLNLSDDVLFLCFNKYLVSYLSETYQEEMPNVRFSNLDALVCSYRKSPDAGGNDGILKFLSSDTALNWKYKHIVIDEGQDFAEEHIKALSFLADLAGGSFYVFYDKNQLVQQRNSLAWASEIECRLVLTANCRNTTSIATTSNRAIGVERIKMRREITGEKPNFFVVASVDELKEVLGKLIRKYTSNGFKRNQIVVLTDKREDASLLFGVKSVAGYPLVSERNQSGGIFFTTARKFKGLESDVIIFIDVNANSFKDEESKRVLYVGTSRAKHFLDFISVADDDELMKVEKALTGKNSKFPKMALDKGLKVKMGNKKGLG